MEDRVINLAKNTSLFKDPTARFLAEGFGNQNYIVEEDGKKYVFRLKKSTETQFLDSLEKEFVFLKYFESCGIDFCPQAIFYDSKENFLVENFLEGTLVSQADFTDEQIDQFAQKLHKLFSLDVDSFFSFCGQNNYKKFPYVDPIASLQQYGFNRLEEARQGNVDEAVLSWLQERLDENLAFLKKRKNNGISLGFSWGDIQSEMIVDTKGGLFFYDFEHVTVSDSFGLSYIKTHGSFSVEQLDFLLERCAKYFNRSKEELVEDMNANERIVKVNDVVWAAMMLATTGDDRYQEVVSKRIDLVKELL